MRIEGAQCADKGPITMADDRKTGDRIAKVMARAGVASRRNAERMIIDGRVTVNGIKITSPALDIRPSDRVTLDGKPIDAPQPARLWLYYKPLGLVTSENDEKGRQTVFDTMPDDMPRVMSVGRLDLNSEGLLLLTNDGALKRQLELPSTGWLRKYRVRVNGRPSEATFDPLRRGLAIDGEEFLPMDISLDKQQGANAWLTIGLREGKNREIRRAMAEVGLIVNRLIRVSYGPFRLNAMKAGDVVEVKQRVLRDQLGRDPGQTDDAATDTATQRPRREAARKPFAARPGAADTKGPDSRRDFKPRPPRVPHDGDERKPRKPRISAKQGDRDSAAKNPAPKVPRDNPAEHRDRKSLKPRPPRAQDADRDRKSRSPNASHDDKGRRGPAATGPGKAGPRKTQAGKPKTPDRGQAGKTPRTPAGKSGMGRAKPRPGDRRAPGATARRDPGDKK